MKNSPGRSKVVPYLQSILQELSAHQKVLWAVHLSSEMVSCDTSSSFELLMKTFNDAIGKWICCGMRSFDPRGCMKLDHSCNFNCRS